MRRVLLDDPAAPLADLVSAISSLVSTLVSALVPALSPPALLALVLALVLVGPDGIWRISRTVVTLAHEGGHALAAVLTGRRLAGIRLHSDSSGLTVSVGRTSGPGMVFTCLAGYIAPSLLGLGAAALVATGWTRPLLWLAVALLLATLIYVRNLFGGVAVVLTGGVVGVVAWYGSVAVQVVFCAMAAWFLLLGGLRAVHELASGRRRQALLPARQVDSDADQLARLTWLPAWVWVGLFFLVALGSAAFGGWLLLVDHRG